MSKSDTNPPLPTVLLGSLRDLPFHQLYEKDVTQMSEQELRELSAVLREQSGSGVTRKAAAKKQEAIITGKAKVLPVKNLNELLGF